MPNTRAECAANTTQMFVRSNIHMTNLDNALKKHLELQKFVDVTLSCEGRKFQCHRLILAASSPLFESLFLDNPAQHPIIIIPYGIKAWTLQALIEFMYKGHVNVSQCGLKALVRSAELLQVTGLENARNGFDYIYSSKYERQNDGTTNSVRNKEDGTPHLFNINNDVDDGNNKYAYYTNDGNTLTEPMNLLYEDKSISSALTLKSQRGTNVINDKNTTKSRGKLLQSQNPFNFNEEVTIATDSTHCVLRNEMRKDAIAKIRVKSSDTLMKRLQPTKSPPAQSPWRSHSYNVIVSDTASKKKHNNKFSNACHRQHQNLKRMHEANQQTISELSKECLKNTLAKTSRGERPNMLNETVCNQSMHANKNTNENLEVNVKTEQDSSFLVENIVCYPNVSYIYGDNSEEATNACSTSNDSIHFDEGDSSDIIADIFGDHPRDSLRTDLEDEGCIQFVKTPLTKDDLLTTQCKGLVNEEHKLFEKEADTYRKVHTTYDCCGSPLPLLSTPSEKLLQKLTGVAQEERTCREATQVEPSVETVVLRNPRTNQPRNYSTEALYNALMAVKHGESIYRASREYHVPRKTLRNWMKRWNIKSQYPMPQQLKDAAIRRKKSDDIKKT